MRSNRNSMIMAAMFGIGTLAGCSGGSDAPATGPVSVSLMDRPVDGVIALYVTITEVWIKPAGSGPAFMLPMTSTPLTLDLLEYDDQNASLLVSEAVVTAGPYNWIELVVDDSTIDKSYAITTEGGMEPVDIDVPSDRIRLVSGFDVAANEGLRVLLDWDVRKGLTEAVGSGDLKLRPAFRILDADEYGALTGVIRDTRVAQEELAGNCDTTAGPETGAVIYVFQDGETPDEIDQVAPEPITTGRARFNETTGHYDYRVALMPGNYIVAATCQGDEDLDGSDDGIVLFPSDGVPVSITTPEEVVVLNFEPL